MKATRTTLHRQFSWNVRFLSLGFPVLDCRLILDHSDMPVGAQYSFETLTRKYVARQTFSHPRYYRTSDPGPDEYLDAPRSHIVPDWSTRRGFRPYRRLTPARLLVPYCV